MRISPRGSLRAVVLASLVGVVPVVGCPGTQAPPVEPATLVVTNGRIVTVDETMPEAQAIAVSGDPIAAVGSD